MQLVSKVVFELFNAEMTKSEGRLEQWSFGELCMIQDQDRG